YLDAKLLWAYVTEGEFWKISPSRQKEYAAAKSHMAFMLARGLEDKLVTHADIVEGITVDELASRLPKSELGKIIKGALECGKRNAPFTEMDLLGSMPPDVLVNYMPLFQVWDAIIEPKIAVEHGYTTKKKAEKSDKGHEPAGDSYGAAAPAPGAALGAITQAVAETPAISSSDDDMNAFMPPTTRNAEGGPGDGKDTKEKKARPKGAPSVAQGAEDPSTWSQEFDEDTEFVDAADLLDEEPTINSKSGIGGKETTV
ncbi:MAG TPA: hypothetical protein VNN80_20545, partial [Polyangiaceae bacterium]|nr:hypothetical protein [Polyangiaceae bacterium]